MKANLKYATATTVLGIKFTFFKNQMIPIGHFLPVTKKYIFFKLNSQKEDEPKGSPRQDQGNILRVGEKTNIPVFDSNFSFFDYICVSSLKYISD